MSAASTPSAPAVLVLAWHGTRSTAGRADTAALTAAVRAALPAVQVRDTYVDAEVQTPALGTVLAEVLGDPSAHVVLVPAFIAAGYHVRTDIAAAVAEWGERVRVTSHLGTDDTGQPDPDLVSAILAAAAAAGDAPGLAAPVGEDAAPTARMGELLLVSAGSAAPEVAAELEQLRQAVSARSGASVRQLAVADAADDVNKRHDTNSATAPLVVPLLVARGFFAEKIGRLGPRVAPLLGHEPGAHHLLRALVSRYRAAAVNSA